MFDFGELRALLTRPPDAAMFEELMALLELMLEAEPDRTREQWFPYVISISKRWPEPIRERFRMLLYQALEGGAATLAGLLDTPREVRWKGERGEHVLMALEDMDVSRLEVLEFGCEREAGGLVVEWLAQARAMCNLRTLDLRALSLGRREIALLAEASHLSTLRVLLLDGVAAREGHLADLMRAPAMQRVEALCLRRCKLSGQVLLPALAASRARLERLDLSDNPDLSARALAAYLSSEAAQQLRSLDVARSGRGDELAGAVASGAPRLTHLNLASTRLSDDGARALTASASVETLQVLNLKNNALSVEGAQAIAATTWPALEVLRLNHNRLEARGVQALMRAAGHLPSLTDLRVGYTIPHILGPLPLRPGETAQPVPTGPLLAQLDALDVRGPGTTLQQALALREVLPAHAWLRVTGRGRCVSRGPVTTLDLTDAHHVRPELHQVLRDALSSRALDGLRRLEWRQMVSRADLFGEVLRHARLSRVEELDLSNSRELRSQHLAALQLSGVLDGLRVLDLSGCYLSPEQCREVLSAPRLRRLERVELSGNWWSLGTLHEAMVGGDAARMLTDHFTRNTRDNTRYLEQRAQLDRLLAEDPTLRTLELGDAALRDEDFVWLATLPGLRHVRRINLRSSRLYWHTIRADGAALSLGGVMALLDSPHINWRTTSLHGGEVMRTYQPRFSWSLHMARADLFLPFLSWYSHSAQRPIQTLNLDSCYLQDGELDVLRKWPGLSDVQMLWLRYNRLTRLGICRFLDKLKKTRRVPIINLRGNPLSDADARYVMAHAAELNIEVVFT